MNASDFRLLTYFVEVVRAGSIRAGARNLRLSPAVVSTAIRDLEAAVGVSVLRRTTRSMALTDAGQKIYDRAVRAVEAAEIAMQPDAGAPVQVGGDLGITLPVELAISLMPPLLREFEAIFPEVNAHVHAEDSAINLSQSEFDAALRAGYRKSPDGSANVLANLPLELVASPRFAIRNNEDLQGALDRTGFIGTKAQISAKTLVTMATDSEPERQFRIQPRVIINNRTVARELAIEGFGAALLLSSTVDSDIESGRLIRLTDRHDFGYVAVRILMRDRFPSAAATAFREFVLGRNNEAA